ncbi:diverse immunoglobulin domain-containing protein 3.1 [Pimephales promelas]|nr:diverse immunoglobulin domain-containing protein 3.1 [Pimephales promelas]
MSDQCDLCLLGLIILSSLLTGTSGVDDDHVFISSGVDVRLSCNKTLSDCKSTTWTYSRFRHSTVELINLGIKKKDTERDERLSLESDCSLNIKNVTEEDYGSYTCQQWIVNGVHQKQGTDARVFLHVLHGAGPSSDLDPADCRKPQDNQISVSPSSSSSSSSQTEISPGRSVTLSCQLYSYTGYSCDDRVRPDGVELLWVNLKTDSRYQISSSSSSSPHPCIITLTTTLLDEDNNRQWRCQLTHRNQLQASVTYTVKYSARAKTSHPTITQVIGISVAAVAVLLLALLWLICRKTADNKRGTGDSAVKDEDEHKGTYETINMSIPPAARADEQTDDVTYSEVTSSNTKPVKALDDHNDTVTYAAIRGREDKPQDQLYATVNKNK